MPDVLEAGPLNLVRWRAEAVDEVLEAVRSSFADLQQWMHWAQTMPTREQQRKALTEGAAAFDAGTEFGFLFRETATGALVGGGGVHRRIGPGAVDRIEIHMDCTNLASARIPEKLGYRLLRVERREQLALGHSGRGYVWAKRRHEWTSLPAREPAEGTR
jgi:RimJ/RimL family protein N-acetyltransferase